MKYLKTVKVLYLKRIVHCNKNKDLICVHCLSNGIKKNEIYVVVILLLIKIKKKASWLTCCLKYPAMFIDLCLLNLEQWTVEEGVLNIKIKVENPIFSTFISFYWHSKIAKPKVVFQSSLFMKYIDILKKKERNKIGLQNGSGMI